MQNNFLIGEWIQYSLRFGVADANINAPNLIVNALVNICSCLQELVGKLDPSDIDLKSLSPSDVVKEIFDSTVREICDEVNIPATLLSDPQLLGVARNTTSAGRPSSEYLVR